MNKTEALEMALELAEYLWGVVDHYDRYGPDYTHEDETEVFEVGQLLDKRESLEMVITTIKEALAQPEQEPLTDEQIIAVAKATKSAEPGAEGYVLPITFARAILAVAAHNIKEQS